MRLRVVLAFVGGVFLTWLAIGIGFDIAAGGAEPDDLAVGGMLCLLCPLVGLWAASVAWRWTRPPKT
jgi:hypothetical protein